MDHSQLLAHRSEKDRFFKTHPDSPLGPQQQARFGGLNYYDPNPVLAFELTPEIFADQLDVTMQTSTGETRHYRRWGRVHFQVEGQNAELTLFRTPGDEQLFIPFTDSTSRAETYGAGRYLEAELLPNGKVRLDFNEAYNPYCAYSPTWSCPIPPGENRLKVPIRAGEKNPSDEWVVHE